MLISDDGDIYKQLKQAIKKRMWAVQDSLDKQAEKCVNEYSKLSKARYAMGILIGLTLSNLILPYILKIPYLGKALDFVLDSFDWGASMIPSMCLPTILMNWQVDIGRWWIGILLALLAMLPMCLGFLLASKNKMSAVYYWLAFIWYVIDGGIFLIDSFFNIRNIVFSENANRIKIFVIFFCICETVFRSLVIYTLFEGVTASKKVKTEFIKMVELIISAHREFKSEEEMKRMPKYAPQTEALDWIRKVAKRMEEERRRRED